MDINIPLNVKRRWRTWKKAYTNIGKNNFLIRYLYAFKTKNSVPKSLNYPSVTSNL